MICLNRLNIVLVEPEIPQNTGNIARTCAATGARLHIIEPMGFKIDDKKLKRAGLDYWYLLDITYYPSIEDFFSKNDGNYYFLTTKGRQIYSNVKFEGDTYIIFGKETKGLPEDLLEKNLKTCIRIPMVEGARSLNLCNSVAIVLYEALRQKNFDDMQLFGKLKGIEF